MCMLVAAVTKDFGVIATDSAKFDMEKQESIFDSQKLFHTTNNKYLVSFIGTPLYLANIDFSRFAMPLDGLSLYLKDYLKKMKPKVGAILKSEIGDKDEQEPNVCMFVLGMHKKIPTLAQYNVFHEFEPQYLWTKDAGIKFSTIYYGGDTPKKNEVFKESTAYMEKKAAHYQSLTPGLVGEILTRGIYKKADLEEKEFGTKYAGGVVNVAFVRPEGLFTLSGVQPIPV